VPEPCQPCEDIEFCCTLVIPTGFSIPAKNLEDKKQFIADNFELAAHFIPGCFDCKANLCQVPTDCGLLTVTQLFIKGTIKFTASLSNIINDSVNFNNSVKIGPGEINYNLDEGKSDAVTRVCYSDIICIGNLTPVCLTCNQDCNKLKISGAEVNPNDVQLIGTSGNEDVIWEVKGTLDFEC